jgi:V/A-type H+-transporting ATPase subunit I
VIARMEKLYIVGAKKWAPQILFKLQQAGVVQIDALPQDPLKAYQLEADEESRLRKWEGVAIAADHAAGLMGWQIDGMAETFQGSLEEALAGASSYERRAAALVEEREKLNDELQLVDQYKQVVVYLAESLHGLDKSPRLAVIPFLLTRQEDLARSREELDRALADRYLLMSVTIGQLIAAVIVTLKREAEEARGILAHEGLRELPRMGEYARMDLDAMAARLTQRLESVPQELAALADEMEQLRQEAGESLQSLRFRATDEANRLRTLRAMGSGRYGFALCGWVPVSHKHRVADVLDRLADQVLYTFEPAEEHHEPERIPVMLENPPWVRPFEALISFLNTPRYDSWDPTWITATLFPFWVGMVVGDIGYGLVFAGLAWYLYTFVRNSQPLRLEFFKIRLTPDSLAQVVSIMTPMIVWTILWGLVYGEFFGNLFQRLGIFGTGSRPGLIPTLIPRTETAATATMLILVSIGFGVFQVLYGFFLKARLSRRHGDRQHFWEGSGYFGGVAALVMFSYAFMTGAYPLWLLSLILAGFSLFVAGMLLARMPLMIAELPTQGGHILSYIRIYAVGLASAILANLATDMGFALYHQWGAAGIIVGVLIGLLLGLLIHGFLIVLLTLNHVLQPIRLIWVEFFTKFDFYILSGKPYRPFKMHGGDR